FSLCFSGSGTRRSFTGQDHLFKNYCHIDHRQRHTIGKENCRLETGDCTGRKIVI
ncbi:hypothetical protein M5D96_011702, partial [Drosophila gunungcola]